MHPVTELSFNNGGQNAAALPFKENIELINQTLDQNPQVETVSSAEQTEEEREAWYRTEEGYARAMNGRYRDLNYEDPDNYDLFHFPDDWNVPWFKDLRTESRNTPHYIHYRRVWWHNRYATRPAKARGKFKMRDYLPSDEPPQNSLKLEGDKSLFNWMKEKCAPWVDKMEIDGKKWMLWYFKKPGEEPWFTRSDWLQMSGRMFMPQFENVHGNYYSGPVDYSHGINNYNYASQGGLSADYEIHSPVDIDFDSCEYSGGSFGGLPVGKGMILLSRWRSREEKPPPATDLTFYCDYWSFDYQSRGPYVLVNGYVPGKSPFEEKEDIAKGERQTLTVTSHKLERDLLSFDPNHETAVRTDEYIRVYPLTKEFMFAQDGEAYVHFAPDGETEVWSDGRDSSLPPKYPLSAMKEKIKDKKSSEEGTWNPFRPILSLF